MLSAGRWVCDTWLIINYDRSHYTIRDTSFHSLMRNKATFEHIETLLDKPESEVPNLKSEVLSLKYEFKAYF